MAMKNNDKKRRGVAQALYCALGGAIMGLAVVMYAMSQSNIDQTISLQAAENSYITTIHVAEEARLFMEKAMDFVLQLAIEDVSGHGGLTSKEEAENMRTDPDGVRYWRWCAAFDLPAASTLPTSCDNSDCGPVFLPRDNSTDSIRNNMTSATAAYLTDYVNAFVQNKASHKVEVNLTDTGFEINPMNVTYRSGLNTRVWALPTGVKLDTSFRNTGIVDSNDTITSVQNVQMRRALDMSLGVVMALPARNGADTYNCTSVSRTFTRTCPMKTHNACYYMVPCYCSETGCSSCPVYYDCCTPIDWRVVDSGTVTDYDCRITFAVTNGKITDTLSSGDITEKDQEFTLAATYRAWSGSCTAGDPPGTGECSGDCYYTTS